MWRTLLPFSASALVPSVCLLTMIQKLYFCERTNKEPINLLYNDVKNLTSIFSFCIRSKYVSSNDDTKALFLCELHFSHIFTSRPFWASALVPSVSSNDDRKALFLCELHFSLILTSRPLNDQRTDKQLMNLLYNDVKNLNSIFSRCNCVNIVPSKKDWKALYQWDNHFSLILITPPERTNK